MRGKWKYILLVFALIILGAGGYGVYVFKFKDYDVADPEIDEIIEDPYILTLPDGTQLVIDKDGNIVEEIAPEADENSEEESETAEEETTEIVDAGDQNQNENPELTEEEQERIESGEQTKQTSGKPIEKPTVASIKQKYMPTLKDLETQANNNLNALISKAYNEYQTKKKNGEKIEIGYFYNKYMGAALELEASTDAVFNSIVAIVEKDLEANGYDKGHAESLREQYEAAKEERRSSLLKKAKEFM